MLAPRLLMALNSSCGGACAAGNAACAVDVVSRCGRALQACGLTRSC